MSAKSPRKSPNFLHRLADPAPPARPSGAFLDDHAGAVGAATSVFIAIFTAVLAWKTWGLHLATRGLQEFAAVQAEDMKSSLAQASRAASAMDNVSKSLERSTKTTEEIVERQKLYAAIQLRAYVFPNDYGLYDGTC